MDEITGNFPGWEYISLILGLLFLAVCVFLFANFIKAVKNGKIYSFVTVLKLGLALFFAVLAFSRIRYFFAYGNSGTFFLMIVNIIFSLRTLMISLMPLLGLFALGLLVSNIVLIVREGFYPANLYAAAFAVLLIASDALGLFIEFNLISLNLPNAVVNMWYCVFCYISCLFLAVSVCALIAAKRNPQKMIDYVLILGCKIRDDGTLYPIIKGRADKALDFFRQQMDRFGKSPVLLPSGGKGTDEIVSEAEAVANYLEKSGIDESHILKETKSVSTKENMLFSKSLIGDKSDNVAFVTSDFHVFRSGILAANIGWDIDGMGARTKWYFWPNAFVREFVALIAATWKSQIAVLVILCAFAASATLLI